ncbi:MAG: AAA family ATPase [SAR324 cluster bacterium]|nr:AAA family ATPase [SAR324 cluster bacterium]
MQVRQLVITKLFGTLDYSLALNHKDHITILHGPNGFGKTTILRILHYFFNHQEIALAKIPFQECEILLEDQSRIILHKDQVMSANSALTISYQNQQYRLEPVSKNQDLMGVLHDIERSVPSLKRTGNNSWQYLPTQEIWSLEDVIDTFGQSIPSLKYYLEEMRPEWLKQLQDRCDIRLIDAQRLFLRHTLSEPSSLVSSMMDSVNFYSRELVRLIQAELARYAALAQSLDISYPSRLLSGKTDILDEAQLKKKFQDLEKNRIRLLQTGLLSMGEQTVFEMPSRLEKHLRLAFSLYVEDTWNKLGLLSELANRIELFTAIVNKLFSHKRLKIDKQRGFLFQSTQGHILSPDVLSSGEKHEMVLLYELLFKTPKGSLILIDEPELSLHVLWQEEFLQQLQKIIKINECDVLVATHSPEIINDRWDLTIALEGDNA